MAKLDSLPVEVLTTIFENLGWEDVSNLEPLCRKFYMVCMDDRLWRRVTHDTLQNELLLNYTGEDLNWRDIGKTQKNVDFRITNMLVTKTTSSSSRSSSSVGTKNRKRRRKTDCAKLASNKPRPPTITKSQLNDNQVINICRFGIQARRMLKKYSSINRSCEELLYAIKHCRAIDRLLNLDPTAEMDHLTWFELMDSCCLSQFHDTNLSLVLKQASSKFVKPSSELPLCDQMDAIVQQQVAIMSKPTSEIDPQLVKMQHRYAFNLFSQTFAPVVYVHVLRQLGYSSVQVCQSEVNTIVIRVCNNSQMVYIDPLHNKIVQLSNDDCTGSTMSVPPCDKFSPHCFAERMVSLLEYHGISLRKELSCTIIFLNFLMKPFGIKPQAALELRNNVDGFIGRSIQPHLPHEQLVMHDYITRKFKIPQ